MKYTSKFITFEGGEGSGKSTHLERLYHDLTKKGYNVVKTNDPGGPPISMAIRPLLLDKKYAVSHQAEFLLYLAARAELVNKVILPGLETADFVLCDRFHDSTAVYQGVIRGWNQMDSDLGMYDTFLGNMHKWFSRGLIPHTTFLLDVDPVLGLNRSLGEVKNESRWEEEGLNVHRRINAAFLQLAKYNPRFRVIDANQGIEDVYTDLTVAFARCFRLRGDFDSWIKER
jgi:dTMP kinase